MGLVWAKRKTRFRCVGSLSGEVTMSFPFLSAFSIRADPYRIEFAPVYRKSQKLSFFFTELHKWRICLYAGDV